MWIKKFRHCSAKLQGVLTFRGARLRFISVQKIRFSFKREKEG